jgi:hypothetical protein
MCDSKKRWGVFGGDSVSARKGDRGRSAASREDSTFSAPFRRPRAPFSDAKKPFGTGQDPWGYLFEVCGSGSALIMQSHGTDVKIKRERTQ